MSSQSAGGTTMEKMVTREKYLKALANQYPSIGKACTEIINLQSILNLPKGTEHFLTDLHGEDEQFNHVLKNGSGAVRRKIDEHFGHSISVQDKKALATLIYYPREKMDLIIEEERFLEDWFTITLHRLVQMAKYSSSKYTRSKIRKALPKEFAYVIEEMITEREDIQDKEAYYKSIISTIIFIGQAEAFIIALCELIQRLVVDHLHIVGDIFDRGPGPHIIMDKLCSHHSIDIQWGNHDIVWMGAASGHLASIATVLRISSRYGNLDIIEDGYGINLVPLITFAMKTYAKVDCKQFKVNNSNEAAEVNLNLEMMVHKAIAIIQFKLEGQLIRRNPCFQMEDRLLLDKIDYEKQSIVIEGIEYPLLDTDFPTIDKENPYRLSDAELALMQRIQAAFVNSEKLQRHARFLFTKGGLYKAFNGNLLYHGCMPLEKDGSFARMDLFGENYAGKALFDALELYARKGYYLTYQERDEKLKGQDVLWYIWAGPYSPAFGKDRMTTFERYFIADKKSHKENKNPYYEHLDQIETVERILEEFGLDKEKGHIINGHVPIEQIKGESPIKCGGKLLIIDGGFSRAYQDKTGIAGYTLVHNSTGMRVAAHVHFDSKEEIIQNDTDMISDYIEVEKYHERRRVADTDIGRALQEQINELKELLVAYHEGEIIED